MPTGDTALWAMFYASLLVLRGRDKVKVTDERAAVVEMCRVHPAITAGDAATALGALRRAHNHHIVLP